ncbi:unnamed protein product [Rotaria sp. Silwood1]|nr:unnamed protein product [Rotaria sp. Silwood1]
MSSTNVTISYIGKLQYISAQLTLYMSIIILVLGVIGNLLNCLVFVQRPLRSKPCAICFLAASILNLIIIFSGILPRALQSFFMIPDQTETVSVLCKLRLVILFTIRTISSWLIALATVDRYLISSPNVNRRQMSNLKNIYLSILIISIISLLVWVEAGYCFDANLIGTPQKCYAKSDVCRIFNDLAQSLITHIIPSTVMLIIGLFTIRNVRQVRRIGSFPNGMSTTNAVRNRKNERSLTLMLFAQVILLTLSTLPQAGQKFYLTYTFYYTKSSSQRALEIETMHTGSIILYRIRGFGRSADQLMFCSVKDDEEAVDAAASEEIIETMHTGSIILYRIRGFGRSADQLMFCSVKDDEEAVGAAASEEISIADYFTQNFRKLMYPYLPCIDAMKESQKKPNWLSMEVVRVS